MCFKRVTPAARLDVRVSHSLHSMVLWLVDDLGLGLVDRNKKALRRISEALSRKGISSTLYNHYEDDSFGRVSWRLSVDFGDNDSDEVIQTIRELPHIKEVRHVSHL